MMSTANIKILVVGVILVSSFAACSDFKDKSAYEEMVQTALNSGERYDSLFHGIYLGMPSKDFYAQCWKLNKEGLFIQGPNNRSVQYGLEDDLKSKAYMHFYPNFYQDKIAEMPISFSYESWSPWVKELATDTLLTDVIHLMEQWYGDGFIEVEDDTKGKAYVKIDGNRRIGVYIKKENTIAVLITDLVARNEQLESALENENSPTN